MKSGGEWGVIERVGRAFESFFQPTFETGPSSEFTTTETIRFHFRAVILSSHESKQTFAQGLNRFAVSHPEVIVGAAAVPLALVLPPTWVVGGALLIAGCLPEAREEASTPIVSQDDAKEPPSNKKNKNPEGKVLEVDEEVMAMFERSKPCSVPGLGAIPSPAFQAMPASESGLSHTSRFRMEDVTIQHGPGGCLFDVETDGDLDLYMVGEDSDYLYLNDGQAHFTLSKQGPPGFVSSVGCLPFDFNGDSHTDLFVFGEGVRLYQNQAGSEFLDVTEETGVNTPSCLAFGASACDVDQSGTPDLVLACYFNEGAQWYGRKFLFMNEGEAFVEQGEARGILSSTPFGNGTPTYVVACLDVNGDESPDIYEGNDTGWTIDDYIWVNDGEGYFSDEGEAFGFNRWSYEPSKGQTENHSADTMGVGIADFFLQRHPSFAISDYCYPGRRVVNLLRAVTGQRGEVHEYEEIGPGGGIDVTGQTGWGSMDIDIDLDGDADLLVATGKSGRIEGEPPNLSPNHLFINQGGHFQTYLPGPEDPLFVETESYATLVGDLDGDYDDDALFLSQRATPQLLRNEASLGNAAKLDLQCPPPNTHCLGAKVFVELDGGCGRVEEKIVGEGFASGVEAPLLIGIGALTETRAIVLFPNKKIAREVTLRAGETHIVSP